MKKNVRNRIALGICAAAIVSQTAGFAVTVTVPEATCKGIGGCNNIMPMMNEKKINEIMAQKRQAIK